MPTSPQGDGKEVAWQKEKKKQNQKDLEDRLKMSADEAALKEGIEESMKAEDVPRHGGDNSQLSPDEAALQAGIEASMKAEDVPRHATAMLATYHGGDLPQCCVFIGHCEHAQTEKK